MDTPQPNPRFQPGLDSGGLPTGYPFRPDWEITPRQTAAVHRAKLTETGQAATALQESQPDNSGPLLLDCRRADEWALARIDGAVLIPMQELPSRVDDVLDAAGSHDRQIIVYCHHGARSMRVTAALRGYGFTNVRSMAGGIDLWSADIDPRVPRY